MAGNLLQEWGSSAAYTITLASLGSSSSKVAGRESDAVVATSADPLDYLVGGKITTGTSPTAGRSIDIWVYGSINDTPLYPDVLDGTDSAETFTSVDIRNGSVALLNTVATDSTSDRTYWFRPLGIAQLFGGPLPKNHGLWVTHDTAVALNATGSNHALYYTPVFAQYT